jgi:hypothetical protein
MSYKHILNKLATPATFVLIGAVARIIPHAPNFAPIGAMALFGGVYMNKKQALTLPILAMIFSDFFLGFDSLPMRLSVYGSFLLAVFVGFWIKSHKASKNIVLASIFSSILFFIITNFSVWAFGSLYPRSLGGLAQSYILAIPFFRNTIFGDLFYNGVFFGGYGLAKKFVSRLNTAPLLV